MTPVDVEPARIVFIRGSGRCASTSLVTQLGLHPHLTQIQLDEVLPEELIEWSRFNVQCAGQQKSEDAIAAGCRAFFEAYCRTCAGDDRIYVHKGTLKAHLLDELLAWWPDAKLIYLVRHPVGVVQSMINADIHRFRGRFGFVANVANSLLRWYNDVAAYSRSSAFGHRRVLQVKYEDLTATPGETLTRIQEFLGVSLQPSQEIGMREQYEQPFRLFADEVRWINDAASDLIEALGYQSVDPCQYAAADEREHIYAERRLNARPPALDGLLLLQAAIRTAREHGHRRLGLLGAGHLMRLVAPRLSQSDLDVIECIFDDDAHLHGRCIGPLTVHMPSEAQRRNVDAVIPITMVHQSGMIRNWMQRLGDTIPMLPLWHEEPVAETVCT